MPYVFLDRPPLKFPDTYGLSPVANDYELPPTPPGLPLHECPRTIAEIRNLLPEKLMPTFSEAIDTSDSRDLEYTVVAWGAFAIHLHNEQYQEESRLIAQGRFGELPRSEPDESVVEPLPNSGQSHEDERHFIDGREVVWKDE